MIATSAHAGPVVGVEGGLASLHPLVGLSLSWDRAPAPDGDRHRVRPDLVPELTARYAGAAEALAGVRLELDLAGYADGRTLERESVWLAPRIGWRGALLGGLELGAAVYRGGWQLGGFAGADSTSTIETGVRVSRELD